MAEKSRKNRKLLFYPSTKNHRELNLGTSGVICRHESHGTAQKFTAPPNRHFTWRVATFEIFKRPNNREDGSDFDDSWTVVIATTKNFRGANFFFRGNEKLSRRRRRRPRRCSRTLRFSSTCAPSIFAPPMSITASRVLEVLFPQHGQGAQVRRRK